MHYVFAVHKSPLPHRGRIFSREVQDWWQGIKKAALILKKDRHARALIISDCQVEGAPHEVDTYIDAFRQLGIEQDRIDIHRRGHETIEQVEHSFALMKSNDSITFVSAPLHVARIAWLCRAMKKHKGTALKKYMITIGWGMPRIKEAVTDSFLTFIFPIIDLLGGRQWFKDKAVQKRRDLRRQ